MLKPFGNIGWKVHELAWNHHEIEFAYVQDDPKLPDDSGQVPKKSTEMVGGSISGCEIFSLLDQKQT